MLPYSNCVVIADISRAKYLRSVNVKGMLQISTGTAD